MAVTPVAVSQYGTVLLCLSRAEAVVFAQCMIFAVTLKKMSKVKRVVITFLFRDKA